MSPARSGSSVNPIEIVPVGDSALVIRVRRTFEDAPEDTLNAVLAAHQRLADAAIPGVIELAPAYTSVSVFYSPTHVIAAGAEIDGVFDWLAQRMRKSLLPEKKIDLGRKRATIEIPVCYDPEFGLDLNKVAQHARRSAEEVIDLHCRPEYRVNCVGFTPGFPYLSGLPVEIAMPRQATPRKEVPAGSVAIGGKQAGIYPMKSPGGWNVIGRTPTQLFDPTKNPPALLRAGDRVRFRPIGRDEFDALKQ